MGETANKVKIVGGGLTGILAAFEAHRLGWRDIELHEQFARLGGAARPGERGGLEVRDSRIYFGPKGDAVRNLLETHGLTFEDFEERFGSVSTGQWGEPIYTQDFGGPALYAEGLGLTRPAGETLADRIGAYPVEIQSALGRYCRWHLGDVLTELHQSAAVPLACDRVYPTGAAPPASPLADELYAAPCAASGRSTAALPMGGFPAFFRDCRKALLDLGVTVNEETLVSPRHALAAHQPGETLVWAADPTPLFKAAGVPTPRVFSKSFAAYVFKARWTGALPFYVQNFTARGVCFRIYVYESRGEALLTAECVGESSDHELRREIVGLLEGFAGELALGELVNVSIKPRWTYHSTQTLRGLKALRAAMAEKLGASFVAGAWEPYAMSEKFAQVSTGLVAALGQGRRVAAA